MVVRPFAKLGAPSLLEYLIFGGAVSFVLLMAPMKKAKAKTKAEAKKPPKRRCEKTEEAVDDGDEEEVPTQTTPAEKKS